MKAATGLIFTIKKALIVISIFLLAVFSDNLNEKPHACIWLKPGNLFETRFVLSFMQKLTDENIYPIYSPFCDKNGAFIIANEMLQTPLVQTMPVFLVDFGRLKFFPTNNNPQYTHLFYFNKKNAPVLPDFLQPSLSVTYVSPDSPETAANEISSFILKDKWLNFYILESMSGSGLGNQLFLYAAGLSYANRFHKKFLWRNPEIITTFELGSQEFILYYTPFTMALKKRLSNLSNRASYSHNYNQSLYQRSDIVLIDGYHQAYKNIENNVAYLQKKLKFKPLTEKENIMLAQKLQSQNSVCLHVRLGDYVSNGYPNLVRSNYYQNSVDYILKRIPDPTFYVFSNNPEEAEKQLKLSVSFEVVRVNQQKADFRDMQLMSLCKHNIIANSSFSWWAALLNKNPDKIVMYPDIWDWADENWINYMRVPGWIEIDSGIMYNKQLQKFIYPSYKKEKSE